MGRELYEELQGFDPQMRAWGVEDLDFGLKCWLMGYPILHDPEAVVGHRFRARFDNYSVPYERLLVNQLRMARKQFTQAVWSEWVERCRARHLGRLADHPEGLWARAWQLFEEDRESVEQERAYLHSRRVRDEFWYAERFGLKWPRLRACGCGSSGPLGGGESGSFRVMTADPSAEPSASPSPPPGCEDHANGIIHRGWDHWAIPNREWNESGGILTTPTGARQNQVTDHVISRRSYPEGFVLEVQFRFDSTQGPLFPIGREAEHKHRPTFLGNSGIGIYGWRGGTSVIQLYEVQVTDCYAMSEAGTQRFLDQSQETRFLRMDFGAGNQRHMEKKDIPAGVLAEERTHLEPINLTDFKNAVSDGGADCLCAVVAGLPVSYFEDVYLDGDTTPFPDGEIFPRETFALWSGSEDEGTEDRSAVRKNPSECSTGTERISCRAMVQDDTAISI